MSSEQLLYFLLALPFCFTANTRAVDFTRDVTVSSEDSAFLPCPLAFNHSMRIHVKWEKDGQFLCQYVKDSNKSDAFKCNSKVEINTNPPGLYLIDVKSSDAGLYKCLMTRLIPPPSEERTVTLSLKVLSLTLQWINSSCVDLLCSLHGFNSQQLNFTWSNATQFLHDKTSSINTRTLCKPNWTEEETITCHAYYRNNQTHHKSITLPNSASLNRGILSWHIIAATSTCAGLILLILLGVAIFKCKQRNAKSGAKIYKNKIYENFILFTASTNPISTQNTQLVVETNIRSTNRSNPQTITQTQREECIYEN